jgi:tRNA U38,U39,U40 pseudouridine synthase TruA
MAEGQVLEALEKGNRRLAGRTAPAQGLCLMEVFYESPEEPH